MLKDILAITGKSGIYKMVSQGKNHVIVESLEDGKRLPIHSYTKISALKDIAIYTMVEEIPLTEVFVKIFEMEGGKVSSVKPTDSASDLKDYFEDVLPEYDRDKVYVSDIKKVIRWYNELIAHNLIDPVKYKEEKEAAEKAISEAETSEEKNEEEGTSEA